MDGLALFEIAASTECGESDNMALPTRAVRDTMVVFLLVQHFGFSLTGHLFRDPYAQINVLFVITILKNQD